MDSSQFDRFFPDKESFARVEQAIQAFRAGKIVVLFDDEDRENEGDFICSAELVTPETVNFMAMHGRGLICLALDSQIIDQLELPLMQDQKKGPAQRETAFTVSIEARSGVTTGISAKDRARTISEAMRPDAGPQDFVVPGHVFPLRSKVGGVLERTGHTEGSVDLAKMSGLRPGAVICEIINDDGAMARLPDLKRLADTYNMPMLSIKDLIQYRLFKEQTLERIFTKAIHSDKGIELHVFRWKLDGSIHLAFSKGGGFSDVTTHVRVHNQRPFDDVFSGVTGDYNKIEEKWAAIFQATHAVFVYLGTGQNEDFYQDILHLYGEQPKGASDPRYVGLGSQILRFLGVKKMIIHSVQPMQYVGLSAFGLEVVDVRQIVPSKEDLKN